MESESTTRQLKDLPTPAFVINRHAFAKNCRATLAYANKHDLKIRPHVKTHKTVEGAFIQATGTVDTVEVKQQKEGLDRVSGFVASTIPEIQMLVKAAEKFGGAPFNDILFGVPIASSKLSSLVKLQNKLRGGTIRILVDHVEQVRQVEEFVKATTGDLPKFKTYLKLDTGYHRAGVPCDARGVKVALAVIQSPALELVGVYSHW